jgi:Tfp pilus assembly protein PilO
VQVKTKNLAVGALVVLLLGMLWYRAVYSPMESKASKAKAAALAADTSSANLRQALNGSSSTKKNNDQAVSSQAMLEAVPIQTAEASFLRSIDAIRVSSGANWQTITPGTPTPAGSLVTISVAITAQGTEDEIARYVAGLSTMKRVFIVDNLTIQSGTNAATGSGPVRGHAGAVFLGDSEQLQISGRIFASATASATTPATGAPAPTGGAGAPTGSVNG